MYRQYNEVFLKYLDLYFDKIMPIIAEYQITRGGTVILVQVENEYSSAYIGDEKYLLYLRDGTISRGIDVPLISCCGEIDGVIECTNFWDGADELLELLDKKQPDCPKIVTEFWNGFFDHWGCQQTDQKSVDDLEGRIMEILRAGYSGLSHYMLLGGTNFGDWGGRSVGTSDTLIATSYDTHAPLNEYCCVTPKYLAVKRLGFFLRTCGKFIMESTETKAYPYVPCSANIPANPTVHSENINVRERDARRSENDICGL